MLWRNILEKECHTEGLVLPIIWYLDETLLSNFKIPKYVYFLYMTHGNIFFDIHIMDSEITVILLVQILVETKLSMINTTANKTYRIFHETKLQQILELILWLLKFTETQVCNLNYTDNNIRDCYSIFTAWYADYKKYIKLVQITNNQCPLRWNFSH